MSQSYNIFPKISEYYVYWYRFSIYMLNTCLSLKRLHGVDIEMIGRPSPVQITHQENHSNAKHYHEKTLKPFIIA